MTIGSWNALSWYRQEEGNHTTTKQVPERHQLFNELDGRKRAQSRWRATQFLSEEQ